MAVSCILGDMVRVEWGGVFLRRNAIARSYLSLIVDIDFCERDAAGFGLLRRELFEDGRDDLAGTTPICVKVYDEIGR